MGALGIGAVVVLVAWMVVLTVGVLLVIRQIALLSLRLDSNQPTLSLTNDGLEIGSEVPAEVLLAVPEMKTPLSYLLVLSATCTPCREVAVDLEGAHFDLPAVALVAGPEEQADGVAALLPEGTRVVRDPEATSLAKTLHIESAPFAVQIESSTVTGKAYLHSAGHLEELMLARRYEMAIPDPEVVFSVS